jgi:flagellar biogenesis protein FliO
VPVVALLLALLAVAVCAVWYARRHGTAFQAAAGTRRLRVVERLALSRRALLLVVEYEGRKYLIGQSGDQLALISRADAAPGRREHEPG